MSRNSLASGRNGTALGRRKQLNGNAIEMPPTGMTFKQAQKGQRERARAGDELWARQSRIQALQEQVLDPLPEHVL